MRKTILASNNFTSSPDIKLLANLPSASEFGKVAVLLGGNSAEREISLESGAAVLAALRRKGIDAHPVDAKDNFIEILLKEKFDRVFIILHGKNGEDGSVQGLLQLMNIPFTGSDVAASALAMDKIRSKFVFDALNIPTPQFSVAYSKEQAIQVANLIGYPVSIKPSNEGSSIGVTRVSQESEVVSAYELAAKYGSVIIEKWIDGKDFFVSILAGEVLPSVQVKVNAGFYDYEAKYKSNTTSYECPSSLTPEKESELREVCKQAFYALGCRGWGRVDIIQDSDEKFWVLEVNTIPGMTSHSLVPMSAKAVGLSFDDLVVSILAQTLDSQIALSVNNQTESVALRASL